MHLIDLELWYMYIYRCTEVIAVSMGIYISSQIYSVYLNFSKACYFILVGLHLHRHKFKSKLDYVMHSHAYAIDFMAVHLNKNSIWWSQREKLWVSSQSFKTYFGKSAFANEKR